MNNDTHYFIVVKIMFTETTFMNNNNVFYAHKDFFKCNVFRENYFNLLY